MPDFLPSWFAALGGKRGKNALIAVIAALVILAVLLGLRGYTDLVKLKTPRSGDDPIYVINQLGYEHMRLLLAVESGASLSDIRLRGDIYLNRIDLLHNSPMLVDERTRLEPGTLEAVVQAADVTDRLIGGAGTAEGREALRRQLFADIQPVRDLMTGMSYVSRLIQTEDRERRIRNLILNILVLEVLLAALIGLIILVLRIIGRLQEANAAAHASADLLRKNLQLEVEKARANEESSAKSRFLSNMSHEIRTPLNGIIGTLQLIDADTLTRDNKDSFDIIQRSSRSLLQIVNGILDIAKIEAKEERVVTRSIEIRRLASDVLAQHEVLASEKSIDLLVRFDEAVPEIIASDPTKLEQILNNLLSNSLKFTEKGSVTLGVERLVDGAGQLASGLRINVTDTGIGISEDDQTFLFEPFQQVDGSLTRRYTGTGLGLSIVRKLVTLLGGSAALRSRPGEGTTVTIELPGVCAAEGAAPQLESDRPVFVLLGGQYSTVFRAAQSVALLGKPMKVLYTPGEVGEVLRDNRGTLKAAIVDRRFGGGARSFLEGLGEGPSRWDIPTVFIQGLRLETQEKPGFATDEVVGIFSRSSLLEALQRLVPGGWSGIAKDTGKAGSPGPHAAPPRNLRVLVVDDNSINRRVLTRLLANMGHSDVQSAGSAAEALGKLSQAPVDLVLMDIQMPEVDGYMATRLIRGAGHGDVKIVACSAHAFETDVQRSRAAGMDAHISKPVVADELAAVVTSLFADKA